MSTTLLYQLALFVHILGAFGLIAAITLEASASGASGGQRWPRTHARGFRACE